MTENSSVTALMGSLIPNLKDPPGGESISQLEKPIRNFTQLSCRAATNCGSVFHLQTPCFVTAFTGNNMSLP